MKRITAIVLSVLVLVSSMASIILTTASAMTPYQIEEYFTNPDNWSMDQETATALGTKPASSWTSKSSSTATYEDRTVNTVMLHAMNHWSSIKLPNLEKNTEYTFSFKFYSDDALASRVDGENTYKYYFQKAVLLANDFEGANFAWNSSTATGTKEFRSDNGGYRWNNDYTSSSWIAESERTTAVTEGAWNSFTFTFNTGNYTDYRIVLLSKVDDIHLCGFTLTEKTVTNDEYFYNPQNWLIDAESSTALTNGSTSTWAYVDTSTLTVGEETVNALKLNTVNNRASVFLPNLKKNTEYTFSLRYYADQLMTVSSGYEGIFKEIILFTPDAENASIAWSPTAWNGVKQYYSYNGGYRWNADNTTSNWITESERTTNAKAAEWNYLSITFNTGEYDSYAVSFVSKMVNSFVYFDQIALTEKTVSVAEHFENPANWVMYKDTAKSLSETDKITAKNPNSYPDIANKTDVVKEGTQSLYMFNRNYYSSIYLPAGLEANTDYTLSFSYYTPALIEGSEVAFNPISLSTPEVADSGFFYNYNGVLYYKANNVSYSSSTGSKDNKENTVYPSAGENLLSTTAGEWHDVTITFNTGLFSQFALTFASKVEKLYLDNFSLVSENDVPEGPGSENEPSNEEWFENEDNWRVDDWLDHSLENTATVGYSPSSWADVVKDSTNVCDGEYSMKATSISQFTSIDLPDGLEPNTDYILSFKYKANTTVTEQGYQFTFHRYGIMATDAPNACFKWTEPGFLTFISYNGGYTTKDFENFTWGNQTTANTVANEWVSVNIPFNTCDFKKFAFVLVSKVDAVYLDAIEVNKYVPPQTTEEYFEDTSHWVIDDYIDKSQEASATIGYAPSASRKVTADTTTTNSSSTSLKVEANNGFVSIPLPGELKANTDYTLSFSYYFDNADIKNLGSGATGVFDRYGIMTTDVANACFKWDNPGFIHYISYNSSYSTTNFSDKTWTGYTTAVKEGGKWINVQIPFNTVNFKNLHFVFQDKVSTLYMDNFTLTEGLPVKETFHDGPKESIVVDFEREWDYIAGTSAGRMEIAETTDKNGAATQALKIKEGEYASNDGVTFLNWQAVSNGTDEVFSIPVKGNQTYVFSVDVKMSDYDKETDQRLLLYADYATSTTLMKMIYYAEADSGVGEGWKTYTYTFVTAENAKVASFGLNAGLKHPEIWVDNITLKESDPIPPFHDGKTDPVIIDFEREFEYAVGIHANRMEVTETIGMDGKPTQALHLMQGDYTESDQVTFVNWATVTQDADEVFTIPVKPRTPYRVSAKVKIDEWDNPVASRLFLFYYDYNNRETSDKSLTRGYYTEYIDKGWVEYSIEFITAPDQKTMSIGINAGLSHPDIWIDDITVDAYERGYMADTKASYVEAGFNLFADQKYATSGVATEKQTFKIPVTELAKFTFGITCSGAGKVHVAFNEDGSENIKTINVTGKSTRYGFDFFTGENEDFVYVIVEPDAAGISYEDVSLFASRSVSFGTDLGLTDPPEEEKDPVYDITYVDADHAINGSSVSADDDADNSDTSATDSASPQTGEASLAAVMLCLIAAAGAMLVISLKGKRHA